MSAFISIPVCVVHSCKVSEYIKLSTAKSLTISPSTGLENLSSTAVFSVSSFLFGCVWVVCADVVTFVVFTEFVFNTFLFVLFTVFAVFVVFLLSFFISFLASFTLFPISVLALCVFVFEFTLFNILESCSLLKVSSFTLSLSLLL